MLCVCRKRTFSQRSLILKSQQNRNELVTTPGDPKLIRETIQKPKHKRYYCGVCDVTCVDMKGWKAHEAEQHLGKCNLCSGHFDDLKKMREHHVNKHHGKQTKCDQCGLRMLYREAGKDHDCNSGVKYYCGPCKETFHSRPPWNDHESEKHLGQVCPLTQFYLLFAFSKISFICV